MRFFDHDCGISRDVFLIGKYAFKFASPRYGYKNFLQGLLANIQEATFSKAGWPELCPVLAATPGGFLIIMPRVRVMTDEEFEGFDYVGFVFGDDYNIPAEAKSDSFGWLDGKIVAVDYGN